MNSLELNVEKTYIYINIYFSRDKITKQNCLFMILSVSVIIMKKFKFIISQPSRDTRASLDVIFWYRFNESKERKKKKN